MATTSSSSALPPTLSALARKQTTKHPDPCGSTSTAPRTLPHHQSSAIHLGQLAAREARQSNSGHSTASRPQPGTGRLPLHRLQVHCLRIPIRLRGGELLPATVSGPQVGQQLPPKARRQKKAEGLGRQAHAERAWQPRTPVPEVDIAVVALGSMQVIPIDRQFMDMAVRKASLPR